MMKLAMQEYGAEGEVETDGQDGGAGVKRAMQEYGAEDGGTRRIERMKG